jgi:hypothetical protein
MRADTHLGMMIKRRCEKVQGAVASAQGMGQGVVGCGEYHSSRAAFPQATTGEPGCWQCGARRQ